MNSLLNKVLKPNKILRLLICVSATILLIIVFKNHLENTFIAYFSYPHSAYALVIFSLWLYDIYKFFDKNIKVLNIYKWYINNKFKISLLCSLSLNFTYGIFKLIIGIYYKSWWLITFASYYLMLFCMKLTLIKKHKDNNLKYEYQKLRNMGIILLFINLILSGIIILVIKQNKTIIYPGYLIYAVAFYDFYLVISAVVNVFKYKNNNNSRILASKYLSLSVALISILSLEVAMIYQFGNNDWNFKLKMIASTGLGIVLINSLMSFLMILKSKKIKYASNN